MTRLIALGSAALLALTACNQQPTKQPTATNSETPTASTAPVTPPRSSTGETLTAQGYGALRIGMTRAEVETALGSDANPGAVGGADPESCDQFRPARAPEGLLVMIQDGVLTRISAASPSILKTDGGFGVGDAAPSIKAAYGARALSQPHKYSAAPAEDIFVWSTGGPASAGAYVENAAARGVRYEINGEGKVQIIHVGGPAIQLVEGCS